MGGQVEIPMDAVVENKDPAAAQTLPDNETVPNPTPSAGQAEPNPQPEQPVPEPKQEDTLEPKQEEKDNPEKEVAEAAGLDYDNIVNEFKSTGIISEDTRAKVKEALGKSGLPDRVVDDYFKNLDAAQALFMNEVYQITEGEEGYEQMRRWASTGLSKQEQKVFSDMAESGDPEQAKMAVRLLYGQYQQNAGTGGSRIKASNGSAAVPSGKLFRNMNDVAAAQADPRYKTDVAYREEVQARLDQSLKTGVYS